MEYDKDILIRTLETKLAAAKNNEQNEILVTLDVIRIIIDALKQDNKQTIQDLCSVIEDQQKREEKLVELVKELSTKGGGAKWLKKLKTKL